MKIYPISLNCINNVSRNKNDEFLINTETHQNAEQTNLSLMPHYALYNVSFTGRTPEDFYAQDFNRENMPSTMKDYLYSDYDKWQHVPPEQLMSKAFEYLEIADNFDDVKDLYPNESLFMNLKEAGKAISSVAYEIKAAKELSDEPVLKNGDDNFGIYLLRKIYLEGKTIKEIDKDFYDKDLNPVYKGVITKPITKDTFRLYGIRYPESAFWNSFIATRDEYKKFFVALPKNENLETLKRAKTVINTEDSTSSVNYQKAPQPRKYRIKEYKLNQFAKEVKDSKGDLKQLEIRLKRRYGKDDPEASFFLKYMSPIMTLVADRIHLSEAMRDFHDLEVEKGFIGDDEVKLARFWKHNPVILEDLSKTIPSTIQMFEEAYGVGGDIPINKDLKIVVPEMEDNVIIDTVSPEFIELLEYTQKIEANRLKRYAKYDELQSQWEKYFIDKYGEIQEPEEKVSIQPSSSVRTSDTDYSREAKVFTNLEDALKERVYALPRKFADKYIKDFMSNSKISEEYKNEILHQYYAFADYENDVVSNNDIDYNNDYFFKNDKEAYASLFAYGDLAHKYLLDEPSRVTGISDYFNLCFGNFFDAKGREVGTFIDEHRSELNSLYNSYTKPLTSSEALQVVNLVMDKLMSGAPENYQPSGKEDTETYLFTKMLSDMAKLEKGHKKAIKDTILNAVSINCPYSRALLNDKDFSDEINYKKFLGLMDVIYTKLYLSSPSLFCCTFNKQTVNKYIEYFSPKMQNKISELLMEANSNELNIYSLTDDEIKQGAVRNYRLKRN